MNRNNLDFEGRACVSQLQASLLKSTLRYVSKHSPYYKRLFRQKKIDIAEINSTDDLIRIPVTTKADLLKNNRDFFCSPQHASDIVMTSGSTGSRPILHPLTSLDLRRLAYNEKVSFQTAGIGREDSVMLATALDGSFVAGLAYYLGLKEIGCNIFRVGAKNFNLQMNMTAGLNCNVMIGVPSNLIQLSGLCGEMKIPLDGISKLALIGESIRGADYTLNQLGRRLASCFPNACLHSTYANTETCTSFCECGYGTGGHLYPDLAYAEIIDDRGEPLPDGTPGRLVITTFGSHGMPLIRYDTGDITFMVSDACPCGRTSQRIGPILSRTQSIFKLNGVSFSQSQLEEALLSDAGVRDYCAVIHEEQSFQHSIKIWISCFDERADTASRIRARIWENVRINAEVNICNPEKLREMQGSTGARKPVRFIIMESPGEDEKL